MRFNFQQHLIKTNYATLVTPKKYSLQIPLMDNARGHAIYHLHVCQANHQLPFSIPAPGLFTAVIICALAVQSTNAYFITKITNTISELFHMPCWKEHQTENQFD